MLHPSEHAYGLLRQFEGFSATPYVCPAGKRTIGFGHVIRLGERFPSQGISRKEADDLLVTDAAFSAVAVRRYIKVPLEQCQFDALVSFVFNVGAGAFARSTLKSVINRQWHDEVPVQMARWVFAGGKIQPGLVVRREAEAALYRGEGEPSLS